MEINKQLFEDVLSGKLKGAFVLRNGIKISYRNLTKHDDCDGVIYPYHLDGYSYTPKGRWGTELTEKDIVDFIPDTNMKENELTIEIPKGKTVDWEESKKQNKIVLKDKQLTYKDVCEKLFCGRLHYINERGKIDSCSTDYITDPNNATTSHQLECILAKNKLANVAKYLNDGWKPSKTGLWYFDAWVLFITPDGGRIGKTKILDCSHNNNVLFKSKELAQQAVEILGEETIKLALEPLGI